MDPLIFLGIAVAVALLVVVAAVPKFRKVALIALGAVATLIGIRAIDRLIIRGGGVPFTPLPDKEGARARAREEEKTVTEAREAADAAAPVRDEAPDLTALEERAREAADRHKAEG